MSRRLSFPLRTLRHLVLLAGMFIMVGPFIWMAATSLKPPNEVFSTTLALLPHKLYAYENYRDAFTKVPLARNLVNGVLVTLGILLLQLLIALPCAYALAKLKFRGRTAIFLMVLAGLMIPAQVPAIPRYVMLYEAGMINTYGSLVIPFVVSTFGIFLMRQYFRTVPDDLIHAARLDGCGEFSILWRIMVPSAMPAIVAFAVLSIVGHWNDFFWPYVVITDNKLATPPLAVLFFRNQEIGSDYGPLMAATVVVTAPLLLLFLVAQRRFIEGVTMTGIKG
jgi:multiple sugar transport system permease protein